MGKLCSCMQYIKSRIFTTSHTRIRVRYLIQVCCIQMCNEIKSLYDHHYSYTGKISLSLLFAHFSNTDSNEDMIFSDIALYHSNTYIYNYKTGKYHEFVAVCIVTSLPFKQSAICPMVT